MSQQAASERPMRFCRERYCGVALFFRSAGLGGRGQDKPAFGGHNTSAGTFGIVSSNVSVMAANNTNITLAELQAKYPDGSVWLETFDGSSQCAGFARLMCYVIYGSEYFINNENGQWKKFTNSSYIDNDLKSGDYVRYNGHSVFVISVDGDNVYIVDCNSDWACTVKWRTLTKSNLKKNFSHVYSAPYAAFSDSANHVNLYQTAVVTAKSGLTIREKPDINSAKVGYLNYNENVKVCNYPISDGTYTWRKLLNGNGWICENYLCITSGEYMVSGTYRIQNANGKYLSYVTNPSNDVNIVMFEDLDGTDMEALQQWSFQPLMAFSDTGAIVYRITPVLNSNYSLDCDSTNSELLHLWESLEIGAQQWIVECRADGSLKILNYASGYCLDVKNNCADNNTEVITYTSNETGAQMFYLVSP